ncbi:hypothetical protein DRO33_00430 [Candidatus Bathyarchaeota archaeon]|nr:MAG: hypothetical protein DRO33_00430 [Candidatus Bathyarchaeota archaeon]
MNLWPVVAKELKQLVRDPRSLLMNVAMPLIVMLLFGAGYGGHESRAIPVAVANLDPEGRFSWELIDYIFQTPGIEPACYVDSEEEAIELVRRGEVYGAIIIPEHFSDDIMAGKKVYVKVVVDAAAPFAPVLITQSVTTALYYLQVSIAEEQGTVAIEMVEETVYGPRISTMESFLPITMGLLLHLVPMTLISLSICREKERGTYEQLIMAPISRWDIIGGKLAAYTILSLANMLGTLAIAVLIFDVRVRGPLVDLVLFSTLFLMCSLSLGMLVSVVSKNQLQALGTSIFLFIPSLLFSGVISPVEYISPAVRYTMTYTMPMYYFLRGFRAIMLKGYTLLDVWSECLALGLMTAIYFSLAIILLRMRLG